MSTQVYQLSGGGTASLPNPPIISPRNPATTDIVDPNGSPYQILQGWRNSLTGAVYEYAGGGIWVEVVGSGGAGPITTLTGNSGGAIAPIAGNVNILGNAQATFVGTAGTLTLTQTAAGYPITPFVVGPAGSAGYQTIQAAVTAAGTTPAMIYVQPGTYTENITFVAASNVTIASLSPDSVTITGVHVPPASGTVRFLEVALTSATHIFSSAVAGTAKLTVESCVISCTNGFTFNLDNWTGTLQSFHSVNGGAANGFVTNSGGSAIFASDSDIGNGTGQIMVTTGAIALEQVAVGCPWSPTTGTVINAFGSSFANTVILGGNSTGTFDHCSWSTGATVAITMSSSAAVTITNSKVTSSNNPAISGAGAGALILGGIDFTSNTSTAGTLTISTADNFKAGSFTSQAAITAGTTLTATVGAITATNGNFVFGTAGNKVTRPAATTTTAGANSFGSVTLAGGTATVSTTAVTASSLIKIWRQSIGATGAAALGQITIGTIVAATSFVINAVQAADATALQASDVSVIGWEIVN